MFGGEAGYGELFQDEPTFHWKVVSVGKPFICSGVSIYCGSAERRKVLNGCIMDTLAQCSKSRALMTQ